MRDPWVRGLKLKCPQGQLAGVRREVGWERGDLHRPPNLFTGLLGNCHLVGPG